MADKGAVYGSRAYWIEQLDFDLNFCASRLAQTGEITPMATLHTRHGLLPVLADMGGNNKHMAKAAIVALCVATGADGMTWMVEGWQSRCGPGGREIAPSEDPNRVEVVNVMAAYYDPADGTRKSIAVVRRILRDGSGRPSLAERSSDLADYATPQSGFLADTLPETRVTDPRLRAAAADLLRLVGVDIDGLKRGPSARR
jgi:hypothetical protein